MSQFGAKMVALGTGDKIALPDDAVVAVLERFDPILPIPPLIGIRQTISYAPSKVAQGFFFAWTVWPLLNLCENMGIDLWGCNAKPLR
jgi:hypothetical protein